MVCTSRLIVHCLDTLSIQFVNGLLGIKHLVHTLSTAHHKEVVNLFVELVRTRKDSIISRLHVKTEDSTTERAHPCKLIQMVQYNVKSLVSAPRQTCHGPMVSVCQGTELSVYGWY